MQKQVLIDTLLAENVMLQTKNQKQINQQAKWVNMEIAMTEKEKFVKKKLELEEQKIKKERQGWQEKVDKLETELIRYERDKGTSFDSAHGFVKIVQNPDEAFNILAKKLDNANRDIIKKQVGITTIEKDIKQSRLENQVSIFLSKKSSKVIIF